jgi:hypothetical protein
MTSDSPYGMLAALIFLVLAGLALVILIIALVVSIINKTSNHRPLLMQRSFGYVIGSFILLFTNITFLYTLASIDNEIVRKAFDDFLSYIIMIVTLACMMYIGKRWSRRNVHPKNPIRFR